MKFDQSRPAQKLHSFAEVQALLGGRSRATMYRDIQSGRIPKPVYFGKRPYWKSSDIDALIDGLPSNPQPE